MDKLNADNRQVKMDNERRIYNVEKQHILS